MIIVMAFIACDTTEGFAKSEYGTKIAASCKDGSITNWWVQDKIATTMSQPRQTSLVISTTW